MPRRSAAALSTLFASLALVASGPGHALAGPAPGRPAATFTVTVTDGFGPGSLAAAINAANATAGADVIVFDIATPPPHILTNSRLPAIEDAVTIDGFTASGAQAPDASGHFQTSVALVGDVGVLSIRSSNVTIRGLAFRGYTGTAIQTVVTPTVLTGVEIRNNLIGLEPGQTACGTGASRTGGAYGIQLRNVRGASVSANIVGCNTTGIEFSENVSSSSIGANAVGVLDGADLGNLSVGIDIRNVGTAVTTVHNSVGTNLVQFNGSGDGSSAGIRIAARARSTFVLSNNVGSNRGDGIRLGTRTLTNSGVYGTEIKGNNVGVLREQPFFPITAVPGPAPNTGAGILVAGSDSTLVGGEGAAIGNVVAANGGWGIEVTDAPSATAVAFIRGNRVGTDREGTFIVGNGLGGIVVRNSRNVTVGGMSASEGNVIMASGRPGGPAAPGVAILTEGDAIFSAQDNDVFGNRIGIDFDGVVRGNSGAGVYIARGAVRTRIGPAGTAPASGQNIIANNGGAGVQIGSSTSGETGAAIHGNDVGANAIYANGGLGIDLVGNVGVTANDPNDADDGPNRLANHPVITSVTTSGTSGTSGATVALTMPAEPSRTYAVRIYASDAADPSGFGEGQRFVGEVAGQASASGVLTLTAGPFADLATGMFATATATSQGAEANTGEFSNAVRAVRGLPPGALVVTSAADTDDGTCSASDCTLREAITAANANPDSSFIGFRIGNGTSSPRITLQSALPFIEAPVEIDAFTQREAIRPAEGEVPQTYGVILDGSGLSGTSLLASGFRINTGGSVIRGFAIGGFVGAGVGIAGESAVGNHVESNLIGLIASGVAADATCGGRTAGSNATGVSISSGAAQNVVGGATPSTANTIVCSGGVNTLDDSGVVLYGPGANAVQGNFIGTAAVLRDDLIDLGNGGFGVRIQGEDADFNIIFGNDIAFNGLRQAGQFGSEAGVAVIDGADNTIILGNAIGRNNVGIRVGELADNGGGGADNVEEGTRIEGNGIGYARFLLGAAGWTLEPNLGTGVILADASGTDVGGPGADERKRHHRQRGRRHPRLGELRDGQPNPGQLHRDRRDGQRRADGWRRATAAPASSSSAAPCL